jgi:hypothetical protein
LVAGIAGTEKAEFVVLHEDGAEIIPIYRSLTRMAEDFVPVELVHQAGGG